MWRNAHAEDPAPDVRATIARTPWPAMSDVRAKIVRQPWPAVAIAFGVGAAIGLAERSRNLLVRAAAFAAGSVLVAWGREQAVEALAFHARSWLDARDRAFATPRGTG
jgi:hypothetical protein